MGSEHRNFITVAEFNEASLIPEHVLDNRREEHALPGESFLGNFHIPPEFEWRHIQNLIEQKAGPIRFDSAVYLSSESDLMNPTEAADTLGVEGLILAAYLFHETHAGW